MALIDFSETKRQWNEIRRGAIRTWLESLNEKLGGGLGQFLAPLFSSLPKSEAIRWAVFSLVSVSSMFTILHFINSFMEEQDRYQTALTDIGRHRSEYEALGYVGSTTIGEKKDNKRPI